MIEDGNKNEFRMDAQAKSFRMTGFRWRDTPGLLFGLVLTMALLTFVNFIADRSLSFLDRDSRLLVCGALMGFGAGVWVGRFLPPVRSTTDSTSEPSKCTPPAETTK